MGWASRALVVKVSGGHQRDIRMPYLADASSDIELSIGLVGPAPAVRLMQSVSRVLLQERPQLQARFFAAPVSGHEDPRGHYRQLADRADAAVFAGQLQFDRARTPDAHQVPATFVAATDASLYAALVRSELRTRVDLALTSVDSLTLEQVIEAYAEIGVPTDQVSVAPYLGPDSVGQFTAFHEEAFRQRRSQLALTTRTSVVRELRQRGVPVELIQPTRGAIRDALERGIALARGVQLGAQQIAYVFVQLLTDDEKGAGPSPAYWEQEAGLAVNRLLLDEARRVGAVVERRGDLLFAVTMTHGGVDLLTDRLRRAPFLGEIANRLGLPVGVGVGIGLTAIAAEANAAAALTASIARQGAHAVHLDDQGVRTELSPDADDGDRAHPPKRDRDIVARLREHHEGGPLVVDVDDVSRSLDVTPRTGHRVLASLVEAGLAWPLPTQGSAGGGRPRKRYRILGDGA
jgi:hypothetical protein